MNAAEEKNGLGSVFELVTGLLKNPAVIEGLLAGISAVTASQRVKNPKESSDGFDFGSVLEMLPQILPLLSLFKSTGADPADFGNKLGDGGSVSVFADSGGELNDIEELSGDGESVEVGLNAETGVSGDVYYGNKQEQRENLLLAIRPFLSESRVAAADAMMQINRVSGIFRA